MKLTDPVIKTNTFFSILLLRNDSKVVSFRLSSFWIKFLIFFFVLFSGASGGAGYAAHYYWKKYNRLHRERSELAQKLGENRRQLGRFAGMEKMKESTLPRSTMTEVTTVAVANGNRENENEAAAKDGPPEVRNDAERETAEPHAASSSSPVEELPAETSAQAGAAKPVERDDEALDPNKPGNGYSDESNQGHAKEHPALVDQLQIKSAGNNKFRVTFDLSNRDSQITLNGNVRLAIMTKSGARHDISDVNRDTLRFIINRYKKVITTFTLPPDVQSEDVATLYVTVIADSVPEATYAFSITE